MRAPAAPASESRLSNASSGRSLAVRGSEVRAGRPAAVPEVPTAVGCAVEGWGDAVDDWVGAVEACVDAVDGLGATAGIDAVVAPTATDSDVVGEVAADAVAGAVAAACEAVWACGVGWAVVDAVCAVVADG